MNDRFGLTAEDQKNLLSAIGTFVRQSLKDALAPLEARIAQLESSGVKYCGVWQRPVAYKPGDTVTHDGSLWIAACAVPPMEQPGKSTMWILGVKSQRAPTQQRTLHRNVA